MLFAVFYGFLVNVAYGLFERLNQDIALKIGDDFMVSSLPYRKRASTRRVYRAPASYNVEARCNMNFYAVLVSSNTFVCNILKFFSFNIICSHSLLNPVWMISFI